MIHRGRRHRRCAVLVSLLWLPAIAACGKPPSETECNALLDRYVELLVRSDRPNTSPLELERLKSLARTKAALDPAFRECSARVTRTQLDCAMRAPDVDHLEQCML